MQRLFLFRLSPYTLLFHCCIKTPEGPSDSVSQTRLGGGCSDSIDFVSWCIAVDIYRSSLKWFRLTIVLHHFGLVPRAFCVETDLFLRMLWITVDFLICNLIATYPLIPLLCLHLCTTPFRLYCYDQYLPIVAAFAVVCDIPFAEDLLLLAGLILDHVDCVFNHYDCCIMVP